MQIDLNKLTNIEKLNLINIIWESIDDKDNNLPVDENHIRIIMEREKIKGNTIPWDTAREKIKNIFK